MIYDSNDRYIDELEEEIKLLRKEIEVLNAMWKIVSAARLKELEDTIAEQQAKIDQMSHQLTDMAKVNFELELQNVSLKNIRKPNQRAKIRAKKEKE